jgi:hypothetical protein
MLHTTMIKQVKLDWGWKKSTGMQTLQTDRNTNYMGNAGNISKTKWRWVFLYFHEGTTDDNYKQALLVKWTYCCATFAEYSESNKTMEENTIDQSLPVFSTSDMITDINIFEDTPQKPIRLFHNETSETPTLDMKRFKDTTLFLTPTTQWLHESMEKAKKSSKIM